MLTAGGTFTGALAGVAVGVIEEATHRRVSFRPFTGTGPGVDASGDVFPHELTVSRTAPVRRPSSAPVTRRRFRQ